MPGAQTAGGLSWGAFRASAAREAPGVRWALLTDAQADVAYLTAGGVSQRGIALLYRVSQPAVAAHLRRARERLCVVVPTGPTAAPEQDAKRVPCQECDTPRRDCADCIATMMSDAAQYHRNGAGRLVSVCEVIA